MKNKFTILGSGSSLGSPWITSYWGSCDRKNIKNIRTRCSAHIKFKNISILIDTSPDIKEQFRKNIINDIDAVLYTHEHADQVSGIFELRPFFWKYKKKINIFGSHRTIKEIRKTYLYCFKPKQGYTPTMKSHTVKKEFTISKGINKLKINIFPVNHGLINASGYLFNRVAYISDCNNIPLESLKLLKNLKYLVIDCLREIPHPSHYNLNEVLELIKRIKPNKTILTNLHVDLDYNKLKKNLPSNVVPAYDGLSINF